MFVYLAGEDDHAGVGVVEGDEGGRGDVCPSAGHGSTGQTLCWEQGQLSLTASAGTHNQPSVSVD